MISGYRMIDISTVNLTAGEAKTIEGAYKFFTLYKKPIILTIQVDGVIYHGLYCNVLLGSLNNLTVTIPGLGSLLVTPDNNVTYSALAK